MSGSRNNVFNVDEVTSTDHSALETTAAEARLDAPNVVVAHQIDANAEEAYEAAQQAAAHAKTMGQGLTGEPTTAVNQFKGDAAKKTNAAAAQGKHDMDEVKAMGVGYVEQAKEYVNNAFETAQSFIHENIAGKPVGEGAANVASTIQHSAETAFETVKETAQPKIEKVVHAAQQYLDPEDASGVNAFPTEQLKKTAGSASKATASGTQSKLPSVHN